MKRHWYLEGLKARGISLGLERIQSALKAAGNPQDAYRGVLVAGTNGKGSTSFMLYSLIKASGFRTALYTSPHIREINERYIINGVPISDEDLNYYIENLKELSEMYQLTLFEFETLIAFKYFYDYRVDYAVVEVGMGGRLDATNCFEPDIKVITTISKDHTEFLGETEEEILIEKAGIIKSGNTVISGIHQSNLIRMLGEICNKMGATLRLFTVDFSAYDIIQYSEYQRFTYQYQDIKLNIDLPLLGRHQVLNCSIAITAFLELCKMYGLSIKTELIRDTIRDIRFQGRFEVVSKDPPVIIDGAHNIDGITHLKETLSAYNKDKKQVLCIFSSLKNKNPEKKLEILKEVCDYFIFVENPHPLSLKNEEFNILAHQLNLSYLGAMDVRTALKKVYTEFRDYLTIITGSLYTLERVFEELERLKVYGRGQQR